MQSLGGPGVCPGDARPHASPFPRSTEMSLRALTVPVALLVSAPVLAQDAAKGAQLEVPEFHGVAVSHGIRAEVKPGAKAVRLEGKAEDVARVKLEVRDGVLTTQVSKE